MNAFCRRIPSSHFLFMHTIRNAAILLGLSAGMVFANNAPAHAAACASGNQPFSYWIALGGAGCEVGDMRFSDFNISGAVLSTDALAVAEIPGLHTVNAQSAGSWIGAGTYGYTATSLAEPIDQISADTTRASGANYTGETATTPAGTHNCLVSQAIPNCQGAPFSPQISYVPPTPSVVVLNSFTASSPGMIQYNNQLRQTPGPLAILGAGTAFGFSRKLRSRIKASA